MKDTNLKSTNKWKAYLIARVTAEEEEGERERWFNY